MVDRSFRPANLRYSRGKSIGLVVVLLSTAKRIAVRLILHSAHACSSRKPHMDAVHLALDTVTLQVQVGVVLSSVVIVQASEEHCGDAQGS